MSCPFHKEIGNVSALMIKPVISVQRTLSWIIYSSGLKICRGKSHTSINPKYVICIAPAAFWSCLCPTWRSGFVSFQHADIFKTRILCVRCCAEKRGEKWHPPWNTFFVLVRIISDFMSVLYVRYKMALLNFLKVKGIKIRLELETKSQKSLKGFQLPVSSLLYI